jgi:uncharacterized membrane protein
MVQTYPFSMENQEIAQLLEASNTQMEQLHGIVQNALEEETLIINQLKNPPKEMLNPGQRISDKVARFGGSWTFIISFMIVLAAWIFWNTTQLVNKHFDPYPFILMNLILSCIAALQAPVIMMSQNRTEEKDRLRAENDYLINLKAEIEIRSLHRKLDLLLEEQVKTLYDTQQKQLELLSKLTERVDSLCNHSGMTGTATQ